MVRYGKRRYACYDCYPQGDLVPMNMGGKSQDQIDLENYLKKLFNYKQLTPRLNKQIKNFVENNNYTYSGIHKTLIYFYEIEKHPLDERYKGTIAIVEYYYQKALAYYFKLYKAQEVNKNKTEKDFQIEMRVIVIDEPYYYKPPIKEFKFWEDDENE